MKELVITSESGESRYSLNIGDWIVGRSQEADIRVNDPHVSGKHVSLKVTDDGIHVTNLSRMGSAINQTPVTQDIPWTSSTVLRLAKSVSATWREKDIVVNPVQSPNVAPANAGQPTEAHTVFDEAREGATSGNQTTLAEGAGETQAEMDGGHREENPQDKTVASAGTDIHDHEDSHTRALYTRPFDPEDIHNLRERIRKKRKNKVGGFVLIAIALAGVLVYAWPRRAPVEVEVEWTMDAQGNWRDSFFDSPSGRYQLIVPDASPRVLREDAGIKWIRCDVGRDADVPLQIIVEDQNVPNYWNYSLRDLVDQWMKSKSTWLFDEPLATGMFIGGRSGVPFVFLRYTRTEKDGVDWVGSVRFFRSGSLLAIVQSETPVMFRNRMASLLSMLFVDVSQDFIDSYWEPVMPIVDGKTKTRLVEAVRLGLERDAPAHWSTALDKFREALTLAAQHGDVVNYNAASQALLRFREKQQVYYNGQLLAFRAACGRNERDVAAAIKRMCEVAFSDPTDARFQLIRRDWQLPN